MAVFTKGELAMARPTRRALSSLIAPETPRERGDALRALGVPAADVREDFAGTTALHPLSLYEAAPWLDAIST